MKLKKTVIAFGMAMVMTVGFSAVSYASFPMGMMIGTSAPISMQDDSYSLDLSRAQVKHSQQTAKTLSLPIQQQPDLQQELLFYPGDVLYFPLLNVENGLLYSEKSCPSNWDFLTEGFDQNVVTAVRWANETGTLSVAVHFAQSLQQSKPIAIQGKISLYDKTSGAQSEPLILQASFSNPQKELIPGAINEIVSPMNLHAGENAGENPVTLSFENHVFFKDAQIQPNTSIYLNLDQSFDNQIANRYKSFDIQCYSFLGEEDSFQQPGQLYLPAQRTDSYVYEVMEDGSLRRIQSEFDEETGTVYFLTDSLGYYIVSPILMGE